MIYLDTSVALAHLFAEDRRPPRELWQEPLVSSRLLEYELWARIHALNPGEAHEVAARTLLAGISFLELAPAVLERALAPFPQSVRTLDALHLASVDFLKEHGQEVQLASYDRRQCFVAKSLGIDLWERLQG